MQISIALIYQANETSNGWNKIPFEKVLIWNSTSTSTILTLALTQWMIEMTSSSFKIKGRRSIYAMHFDGFVFLFLDILGCRYDDDDDDERWWKMMMMSS